MESMDKISVQKRRSICLWGMWASLFIGLLYFAIGILLPLDPAEKYRGEEFFMQLAKHPLIPHVWRVMFIIVGLLTIFWITTANTVIRTKNSRCEGIFKFATIVGYVGAVVSVLQWHGETFLFQYMVDYAEAGEMYQFVLQMKGIGIDPNYIFMFGGLGLWYFVAGYLSRKNKLFSKAGNVFAMLSGVDLIITMVFAMTVTIIHFPNGSQLAVMQITALLGGIFGGIYHIIMFFDIKKAMKEWQ